MSIIRVLFYNNQQNFEMLSRSLRNLSSYSQLGMKQRERNYGIHIKKIEQIINKESKIKQMKEEHSRIVEILQKSKDISRKFKQQEDIKHRMNENTKMLCALIDIKRKPRMLTEWKKIDDEIELRKSRTPKKEKKNQQEDSKNIRTKIVESFLDQSTSIKKYKKKIKGEITEYLKRRNNLQKMKTIQSLPLPSTHRKKLKKINLSTEKQLKPLDPEKQSHEQTRAPHRIFS